MLAPAGWVTFVMLPGNALRYITRMFNRMVLTKVPTCLYCYLVEPYIISHQLCVVNSYAVSQHLSGRPHGTLHLLTNASSLNPRTQSPPFKLLVPCLTPQHMTRDCAPVNRHTMGPKGECIFVFQMLSPKSSRRSLSTR